MSFLSFFKKHHPKGKIEPSPLFPIYLRHEESDFSPTPEYTKSLYTVASLLSDDDPEILDMVNLGTRNPESVYEKYRPYWEKIDIEKDELSLWMIFLYGLVAKGYVGANDWKFSLEDFLFNLESSFAHYGLSIEALSRIENQSKIMAPEAFQCIASVLPDGFRLGCIDNNSDQYLLVIAPSERLEKATAIMHSIGERIKRIELGVIEEI